MGEHDLKVQYVRISHPLSLYSKQTGGSVSPEETELTVTCTSS